MKKKYSIKSILLTMSMAVVFVLITASISKENTLEIGQKVPDIKLLDDEGETFRLYDELDEHNFVIYFYPKDDTPGCTSEACQFRDDYETFIDLNARVIGISADGMEKHQKFKEKYNLPFILLSDEENKVRELYGVKGNLFGLIPGRVTFIVDKEGILHYVFNSQSSPKKHVAEAIRILESINNEN